jgi:ferredoxin/flavodoxin---NADP+ reductase
MDSAAEPHLLHAAIVGGGPSGFYAAEALLRKCPGIRVDMFDRLPTPFGLVRGGVAPDHPKIKQVSLTYDKIARSPGFAFWGNVEIGTTLTIEDLTAAYHVVVLAYGASVDRALGIPGEELPGSHTSTELVGWYNGHPDYQDRVFDFSGETAVIIGQGNVAADLARMLATPVDELRRTDITQRALEALAGSRIRDIHVVGRRGPAQAKFTSVELKELGQVRDCAAVVNAADLELDPASTAEIADPRADETRKNFATFRSFSESKPGSGSKRILFHFLKTPVQINSNRKVESITLAHNRLEGPAFGQVAIATSQTFDLPCDLVFRSVGYKGVPVVGVSFEAKTGIIPNARGRCLNDCDPVPGLYVTGWIKRGPTGIIGTNRADSVETVDCIIEDLSRSKPARKPGIAALRGAILERGARVVTYAGWQQIDAAERARGQPSGKPREKFTLVADMIALAETGSP